MVGRSVCENPFSYATIDLAFYNDNSNGNNGNNNNNNNNNDIGDGNGDSNYSVLDKNTRRYILDQYIEYATSQELLLSKSLAQSQSQLHCQRDQGQERGRNIQQLRNSLIKPLWNIFYKEKNGKFFRQKLSELLLHYKKDANVNVGIIIREAVMNCINDETLDMTPHDWWRRENENTNTNKSKSKSKSISG